MNQTLNLILKPHEIQVEFRIQTESHETILNCVNILFKYQIKPENLF